ncbi:MAG: hypothetical protein IVW36_11310 [Dehalococcoidia bacterium]|nr:hypothetical protein [Dehalococcoidia bacterium]
MISASLLRAFNRPNVPSFPITSSARLSAAEPVIIPSGAFSPNTARS